MNILTLNHQQFFSDACASGPFEVGLIDLQILKPLTFSILFDTRKLTD